MLTIFGVFIAKALLNNYTVGLNLSSCLIKYILGIINTINIIDIDEVTMEDMKEYDKEIANHLNWLLVNDVDDLGLCFEYLMP